jgi:malate/lactate dehydrogenase
MTARVVTVIVEGMAANYEIRIKGRVGDSLLVAFEGLSVTTEPVETILHGSVPDQEALHELLAKIQSLGLEVVELRRLPAAGPNPDANPPPSS